MIKKIAINDNWLFKKGFESDALEPSYDFCDFYMVGLPHSNVELDYNYFNHTDCQTLCTYSRILVVDSDKSGCKLLLHFDGILSYVEVYVNGIFVTSHKGDAPFDADITAPIRFDYENRIVLKVDSSLQKAVPSVGNRGAEIAYGGIFRDVFFMALDGQNIENVFISTPLVSEAESSVQIVVSLYDYYPDTTVSAVILGEDNSVVGECSSKSVQGATVALTGCSKSVILWTCDNPVVYTLKTTLKRGNLELDISEQKFGFVRANFRRDGFYLNGKLLKLIGLNRYDSYPVVGRAMPALGQVEDAWIIKNELNCNVVRTIGLASKDFIDECSRIGLLVIEDIGGDGYLGRGDWCDAVIGGVRDMVRRDRNSPCIIGWGVRINNSRDYNELYFKTVKAAHDADPTRAAIGARSFMSSHLYEDVYGFNDYLASRTLSKRVEAASLFVPYLITEHTGKSFPVKIFDNEQMRLEQSLRHLNIWDKALESGRTSGAIGMCLSDFYAGRGKGSGDNINYYGVTDMYRNKKMAGYAYASQGGEPSLELSSNLSPDEFGGKLYVFTNADYIKLFRNNDLVGQFYPNHILYRSLKHPPIVISDFMGNLPESDNVKGYALKLFKRIVADVAKYGILGLKWFSKMRAGLLKKILKLDGAAFAKLIEKYSLNPPEGVVFRLEGYIADVAVLQKTIGGAVKKTLCVECKTPNITITKSYELVKINCFVTDGNSNICDYEFSPLNITTKGCFTVVGASDISFKAGVASFYVKNIGLGNSSVIISSQYGDAILELSATASIN